jgi:hypothetical protein
MTLKPFKVSTSIPSPGMEDMDWTEPFLERGTTFSFKGQGMKAEKVAVERAWVRDERLHVEGTVWVDL